MPRYVIERIFHEVDTDEQMAAITQRSIDLVAERFPELNWEYSQVVQDGSGNLKSFCVYGAPSEDALRMHSEALGQHRLAGIYEIVGELDPAGLEA